MELINKISNNHFFIESKNIHSLVFVESKSYREVKNLYYSSDFNDKIKNDLIKMIIEKIKFNYNSKNKKYYIYSEKEDIQLKDSYNGYDVDYFVSMDKKIAIYETKKDILFREIAKRKRKKIFLFSTKEKEINKLINNYVEDYLLFIKNKLFELNLEDNLYNNFEKIIYFLLKKENDFTAIHLLEEISFKLDKVFYILKEKSKKEGLSLIDVIHHSNEYVEKYINYKIIEYNVNRTPKDELSEEEAMKIKDIKTTILNELF